MLIDFHCRVYDKKEFVFLCENSGLIPYSDGTRADLLKKSAHAGVTASVILNAENSEAPENVVPFFGITPDNVSSAAVFDAYEKGFRGIALDFGRLKLFADDKRLDGVYSASGECKMTVSALSGYDPRTPDFIYCSPSRLSNVIRAYPSLTLVCSHMGGYRTWDEAMRYLCGKDVYFDTASCAFGMSPSLMRRMIREHGAERILFGSGMPWCPPSFISSLLDLADVRGNERELIDFKNALSLFEKQKENNGTV